MPDAADRLSRFAALGALVAVLAFFAAAAPGFATLANVERVLVNNFALLAIAALGMTLALSIGAIDLSLGTAIDVASLAFVSALAHRAGFTGAALAGLGAALAVGAGNALLVTRLGIAPFLATLGTLFIGQTIQQLATGGGQPIYLLSAAPPAAFDALAHGAWLGVAAPLWIVAALALALRRMPGRLPTLALATFALLAMARYIWWRSTETLDLRTPLEACVGYLLYAAEAYTWLILVLGFVQTAWPLERPVARLPDDPAGWPSVDVYIPTYDEPLAVVKPAIFAAQSLDWPADRLNVYLLDDGRRPAFEAFARDAGIGYLTRDDNRHAKAGNINSALARTHGEYVAIFDCDHVPTRSFLQTTMGAFLRDPNCALVQTPHHFFSPDPFERNLGTFRRVPNEGSLFYGLVQAGNDLWNAAFFCGSCAVLKRGPLEEVGGVAVETVTEDAHTALKLHRRGYTSAYLPTVQAAGLATESLAGHIRQRARWARGMAQIFRIDNPFVGRGLGFFQRVCYGNAMLHFFYGIPRLVFLTMPIAYLFFHLYFINASALALASYVLPYMALAHVANARMQGRFRHSFWAEVYESVLAWYIALPTTIAFLSPKHGKFNVTAKGGRIDEGYVDWATSRPYLALFVLNVAAIFAGGVRLAAGGGDEASTILMNVAWALYNLAMLGAALAVAREAKQVRVTHRIAMRVPATLLLADGTTAACHTKDYSAGGLGLDAVPGARIALGDTLDVCVSRGDRPFHFPVRVTRVDATHLGVQFERLTLEQERQLVQCTFGRADAWLDWRDANRDADDAPLRGLKEVLAMGFAGYARMLRAATSAMRARRAADRTRH
ncbi:UDP-forming cellulose synthase catalytic subunit [Burkholderia humptydooensis]|uniref:UDP-forming cellulose synthase catalytic subunit n=1 Tax=Burkholderia humptydooensis TaxID=430531 RepID=UPI00016AF106|nr:UDP-forming cellulose synthase catalytic subunit [Burkholderia humptydooensis]